MWSFIIYGEILHLFPHLFTDLFFQMFLYFVYCKLESLLKLLKEKLDFIIRFQKKKKFTTPTKVKCVTSLLVRLLGIE